MRGVDLVVVVHLVADQHDGLFRAAQHVGHHHVEIGDAGRHLNQKEDHVGLFDGEHHLAADLVLEYIVRIDGVTAGVDDREFPTVPIRFSVVTVAGGSGRGVYDGFSLSHQPVEERTFTHVGATYDGY